MQGAGGVTLAADVIAVEAHADVEAPHLHVDVAQQGQREQGGLRRVDRTGRRRPARPGPATAWSPRSGPHDDDRGQVAVGVAHGDGPRVRGSQAARPHPGERRVPGDVDAAGGEVLDLALVVGVQHVVEGEIVLGEPAAEPVPDRHHLGVVGDGARGEAEAPGGHRRAAR